MLAEDIWEKGRCAVSLCKGFKAIQVKPENVEAAPRKPGKWLGMMVGLVPEKVVVRVLLGRCQQQDIVDRIIGHLKIGIVDMAEVSAVACSSNQGDGTRGKSMHGTLMSEENTWWISKNTLDDDDEDEEEGHHFNEWVQYRMGPVPRRCDFVSMRIPQLPAGPLSVRIFHLEVPSFVRHQKGGIVSGGYHRASEDFITLDTDEMQEFRLVPPIESQFLRVVCTENASNGMFGAIGFFDISFS